MTTLSAARSETLRLLRLHNLPQWGVEFDKARARAGQTRYATRKISLSRYFIAANDIDRVRRTILHEIAHVLTEGHGHDKVWKATCLRIGGDGLTRSNPADTVVQERPYVGYCSAKCSNNGNFRRFRLTDKARRGHCTLCRKPLVWKRNFS